MGENFPCWNNYPCRNPQKHCCPIRGAARTNGVCGRTSSYPPGPFDTANCEDQDYDYPKWTGKDTYSCTGCHNNISEMYVYADCGRHTGGPGLSGPKKRLSKWQKERLLPVYKLKPRPNVAPKPPKCKPMKQKCGSGKRKKPFYSLLPNRCGSNPPIIPGN